MKCVSRVWILILSLVELFDAQWHRVIEFDFVVKRFRKKKNVRFFHLFFDDSNFFFYTYFVSWKHICTSVSMKWTFFFFFCRLGSLPIVPTIKCWKTYRSFNWSGTKCWQRQLGSPLPLLPTNLRSLNLAIWFFIRAVAFLNSAQEFSSFPALTVTTVPSLTSPSATTLKATGNVLFDLQCVGSWLHRK